MGAVVEGEAERARVEAPVAVVEDLPRSDATPERLVSLIVGFESAPEDGEQREQHE